MKSAPLVSVILPVKNGEKYLAEALDSILAQDYAPFELIVVDGHSEDQTAQIAKAYPQVQYILQTGEGLWNGYNNGLEAAQGELISFLSHDDLWVPHKLSTQVDFLQQNPDVQYVISRVKFFLQRGSSLPTNFRAENLEGDHVFRIVDNVMLRRSVFEDVGEFNPELHIGGYLDWFSRIQHLKMGVVQDILLHKRIHDENYSFKLNFEGNPVLKVMKQVLDRKRAQSDKLAS